MTVPSEEPFNIPSFLGKPSRSVAENRIRGDGSARDDELDIFSINSISSILSSMIRAIPSRLTPLIASIVLLIVLTMFYAVMYPFSGKYRVYFTEHFNLFSNQPALAPESLQGVLRSTQIADYNDDDHQSTRHISAHTVERAVAKTQPQIPVAVTAPLVAGADVPARSIDPPHTTANTVGSAPAMIADGSNHDDHPSTRHISAHGVERAVAETEPQIPVAVTAPLAAGADVPARSIEPPHTTASPAAPARGIIADGSTQPLAGAEPIDRRVSYNETRFGMAPPFDNLEADGGVDTAFTEENNAGRVGGPQLKLITADDGAHDRHPAILSPEPPKPVALPKLLPQSGQLKPIPAAKNALSEAADPHARVELANGAARVQPTRAGYINAIQVYHWSEGALYQLYAAPGEITDVALEPGERLVGTGPVAAGDTVRWIIDNTESGSGPTNRVHILIEPTRPELVTNLVIDTDRRTYHLELRSDTKTYMAAVSWIYP
jgi:Conjugal transfer protein